MLWIFLETQYLTWSMESGSKSLVEAMTLKQRSINVLKLMEDRLLQIEKKLGEQ